MPRDAARAELAALQRARLYPERHTIEGVVYAPAYQQRDVDQDGSEGALPLLFALDKLVGKRVRITITVLPDAPEGGER